MVNNMGKNAENNREIIGKKGNNRETHREIIGKGKT